MSLKDIIPKPVEIGREALIVIGGAIVAAAIVAYTPALREWIKQKWDGVPNPLNPWA